MEYTSLYAHELPVLIAAHDREARRLIFSTRKSRDGHKRLADKMRNWLLEHFPALKGIRFEEWEDYLISQEVEAMKVDDKGE